MKLKNFTAFPEARLEFARHLNVIAGENGMGKTHLLKLPYVAMAVSAEEGRKRSGRPTKNVLQTRLAEKLVNVLRPERLGHLVSRQQGRSRCEVMIKFSEPGTSFGFSFATPNRSEVTVDLHPTHWRRRAPVYLPTHELLTIYPGFVSLYDTHYVDFDETWRDTCLLLGAPALRGLRASDIASLLTPLEEQLGARVVLDRNGRFYLAPVSGGKRMEIPLVAEGLRKVAMLAQLIATGSLLGGDSLFWDEPESNLNPRLIREVARATLRICEAGVQVFIATHSLFLLREFEILLKHEFKEVEQRYFALCRRGEGVEVSQADDVDGIDPLVLLDEDLSQSERFVEEFMS
jgi:energy-coupling factor transporter ATP-binding protein EcfA2